MRAYNREMEEFLKYLAGEWGTLSKAPLIFLAAFLVIGWLAYRAARWTFDTKEQHLNAQLRLRDDQIADYKNKLSGATPDEAKARIDTLEAQIKQLLPRSLTETQISALLAAVSGIGVHRIHVCHRDTHPARRALLFGDAA